MPELCEGNIGAASEASPEYSLGSSSAPADSKLKRKASHARVSLFVICRCMSPSPTDTCRLSLVSLRERRTTYIGSLPATEYTSERAAAFGGKAVITRSGSGGPWLNVRSSRKRSLEPVELHRFQCLLSAADTHSECTGDTIRMISVAYSPPSGTLELKISRWIFQLPSGCLSKMVMNLPSTGTG